VKFSGKDADLLRELATRLPLHADRAALKLIAAKIRFHIRSEKANPIAKQQFEKWLEPEGPEAGRRPWWRRWLRRN
jgi:hypothetical protein